MSDEYESLTGWNTTMEALIMSEKETNKHNLSPFYYMLDLQKLYFSANLY